MNITKSYTVLKFGWEFPPHHCGGLGIACQGLVEGLLGHNIKILLVLPVKAASCQNGISRNEKLIIQPIDSLLTPYQNCTTYTTGSTRTMSNTELYGHTIFEEVERYARAARNLAVENNFDIIHAHDWMSFKAGTTAKRVSGKPFIAHVHATEFDRSAEGRLNHKIYTLEKEGLDEADAIIAVSHFTKEKIIRYYDQPEKKISVIHNAASWPPFASDTKRMMQRPTVLFVGRLTAQKGPHYLLDALVKVKKYNADVRCIIAGSGDMETCLKHLVIKKGLKEQVVFAGFLRGDALEKIYSEADVLVMPSVSEPFGLTALEALQRRIPAIISKQSGASEVIRHCLKIDFWDIEAMAQNIIAVFCYPELKQELVDNGYQEVKQLRWLHAAEKCINLYGSLL